MQMHNSNLTSVHVSSPPVKEEIVNLTDLIANNSDHSPRSTIVMKLLKPVIEFLKRRFACYIKYEHTSLGKVNQSNY